MVVYTYNNHIVPFFDWNIFHLKGSFAIRTAHGYNKRWHTTRQMSASIVQLRKVVVFAHSYLKRVRTCFRTQEEEKATNCIQEIAAVRVWQMW